MPLPRYFILRGDTYYIRRPIPLDLQAAFSGRKEIVRTLGTTSLKAAVSASHAVLAGIEQEFDQRRRVRDAHLQELAFLASDDFDKALAQQSAVSRGTLGAGAYAWRPATPEEHEAVKLAISTGAALPRPSTRTAALASLDYTLGELECEAGQVQVVLPMDEDDSASLAGIPARHASTLKEMLEGLLEADRRSLEAQRAMVAGVQGPDTRTPVAMAAKASLTQLSAVWLAQRKPAVSSQADMRTAISRFEAVAGPLPYSEITDEHARRFKSDLIGDAKLKNGTRKKLWGMLRALLNVAVDVGLLAGNPFVRVKLKLDDDADSREDPTCDDLRAVFSKLPPEEWWIARIGLYTGARLGEICPLTKSDLVTVDGVLCLHIREDAAAGRSVKNRGSIRKVPVHQQLIADGLLDWVHSRLGERIFSIDSAPASKRLNRRMRNAGLGDGKVFHSFRHNFKTMARKHMAPEWHDRITGHAAKSVGQTYGSYDLRTMKEKIDLMRFGVETSAEPIVTPGAF
jgi:integrase